MILDISLVYAFRLWRDVISDGAANSDPVWGSNVFTYVIIAVREGKLIFQKHDTVSAFLKFCKWFISRRETAKAEHDGVRLRILCFTQDIFF